MNWSCLCMIEFIFKFINTTDSSEQGNVCHGTTFCMNVKYICMYKKKCVFINFVLHEAIIMSIESIPIL